MSQNLNFKLILKNKPRNPRNETLSQHFIPVGILDILFDGNVTTFFRRHTIVIVIALCFLLVYISRALCRAKLSISQSINIGYERQVPADFLSSLFTLTLPINYYFIICTLFFASLLKSSPCEKRYLINSGHL